MKIAYDWSAFVDIGRKLADDERRRIQKEKEEREWQKKMKRLRRNK